jgi:septal ring factor EnvC (AmiA/AmiB activator)
MPRLRALPIARLVLAALAVALWAPAPGGAQGIGELRERAAQQRAQERSLAGGAARLGALIGRVERQLAALDRRRAAVAAELAADETRLARIQADLRAERARLARLRARLAEARAALRSRLVALYKAPEPDLATIALSVNDFSDLVERTTFLRRVRDQDQRVVELVRAARADARRGVAAYARAEARASGIVRGMRARRDALASMSQAAAGRRATLSRARAARLAALGATRASRRGVERRIESLEAAEARAARARAADLRGPAAPPGGGGGGGGGPWAIPWAIVQCESGGQNLPPNSAGASGYYQIIPGTWRLHGGRGPAAWKASKAEQDRVASRIWNGGAGASQWVCASLV